MTKSRVFGLVLVFLASLAQTVYSQNPIAAVDLKGHWQNNTNGDLMGLIIEDEEKCALYVERAFGQRNQRLCRYEAFEDRYVLFLFNDQGVCGNDPDFEFFHSSQDESLRLLTSHTEIVLQRYNP